MQIRVGTSGFSYKGWKGSFYPEKLPAKDMLRFYADKLIAVEINNTFYRMPKASVLEGWAASVPEHFRFAIKASRRITHNKRLKEVEDDTAYLLGQLESLGERLGVVLFQLPPNFKKDVPRLQGFLKALPKRWRAAFEFRHESWFDDEVYDTLRNHSAALATAETEDHETADDVPFAATADWGYLRLRRVVYTDEELQAWASRIKSQGWSDTFVFFKHEDKGTGPSLAKRFLELYGS